MPIKSSKYKQSIFDVALQGFGTLDNLITLSNDNSISLSDILETGTNIIVNNDNLGEEDIKKEFLNNNYASNNHYQQILNVWILADGTWNDYGTWIDTETWID